MKEKIGFKKVLDIINLLVINSWKEGQTSCKKLLKDAGENENIDNRQKTELLIFEMLAMTVSIRKVFNSELLLDSFHEIISEKVSNFEGTKEHFKKLLLDRYADYQETLEEGGSFIIFSLGKKFADNFLDKDTQAMALINYSGEVFFMNVKEYSKLLEEIIAEYEVI